MPTESSVHAYFNWAKERIDEMDAAVASLEAKASEVKADSKVKSDQLIADLKKQRDEFQAVVKKQAKAEQAAWEPTRKQLESQWNGFQARVKTYFDTVAKQIEQQQATFRDVAAAQVRAWRAAADVFHDEAAKIAAARRADVDTAIKEMKAGAAEAEAQLNNVKQAGNETWNALSAALAASRRAFDRANQQAGNALTGGSERAAS